MNIKELSSKIKLIKTNGAKLDALIQEAALGCIEHAAEHGDVRPANQLWEAMPNGSRRNALGMYLCQYGAMRVNTGKDKGLNPRFDGAFLNLNLTICQAYKLRLNPRFDGAFLNFD